MAQCVAKIRKDTRVCIGSLNKRITIQLRALTADPQTGVDFNQTFLNSKNVWSMVETVSGKTMFDKSNITLVILSFFF